MCITINMLKACWDCINGASANSNQVENEEAYGIRLNGDTQRAPPWPWPRLPNEKMFLLPKRLEHGDKIHIAGQMSGNPQSISVNLITGQNGPDYQNIACQLEINFSTDEVLLKTVQDGNSEIPSNYHGDSASDLFSNNVYDFNFTLSYNTYRGSLIDVHIGPSILGTVTLKHSIDDIRYLTVHGDIEKVNKLDFEFA